MAALPYMQLYIADYLADTMHLSTEEHGAYLLLLFNYWQTGKPIPKARLSRIARLSNDRWTAVECSLNEFFKDNGTEWVHDRVEDDLACVRASQDQRSAAGKASAEARKNRNATGGQRKGNDRSTTDAQPSNEIPTNTDTDTDTDTDSNNPPSPPAGGKAPAKPRRKPQPKAKAAAPAVKSDRAKPRRALPLPFLMSPEMLAWAASKAPAVTLDRETERFIDYWTGQGGVKADWPATWRNWMQKAQDDLERRGLAKQAPKGDSNDTSWIHVEDGV